jgi:hypothetical protein
MTSCSSLGQCRAAFTHIKSDAEQAGPTGRLQHPLSAAASPGGGVAAQLAGCQLAAAGAQGGQAADYLEGDGHANQVASIGCVCLVRSCLH